MDRSEPLAVLAVHICQTATPPAAPLVLGLDILVVVVDPILMMTGMGLQAAAAQPDPMALEETVAMPAIQRALPAVAVAVAAPREVMLLADSAVLQEEAAPAVPAPAVPAGLELMVATAAVALSGIQLMVRAVAVAVAVTLILPAATAAPMVAVAGVVMDLAYKVLSLLPIFLTPTLRHRIPQPSPRLRRPQAQAPSP